MFWPPDSPMGPSMHIFHEISFKGPVSIWYPLAKIDGSNIHFECRCTIFPMEFKDFHPSFLSRKSFPRVISLRCREASLNHHYSTSWHLTKLPSEFVLASKFAATWEGELMQIPPLKSLDKTSLPNIAICMYHIHIYTVEDKLMQRVYCIHYNQSWPINPLCVTCVKSKGLMLTLPWILG